MSINTANLITTNNGQEELAKVHSLNMKLETDKRGISVKLLFPYMAISNKTPEVIEEISSSTEQNVRDELCWANVDICQVQKYSVLETTKRDFTIGGLFDVRNDITGAVTIILFAKSKVVDNRTEEQKIADGYQSAVNVVLQQYNYSENMLPYAYTRLLDSTGTYSTEGINISASRYGRSRHRFYFNYIIDNNDGIANNITVNDNVYPYSDSYLSKTAFELGLKRYEDALERYNTEYQKYARGRNLYYENIEDALKNSANANKFYIKENEFDLADFSTINPQEENSRYNWEQWPGTDYYSPLDAQEVYKEYTAKSFDPLAFPSAGKASDTCRGMKFSYKDVRKITYVKYDGTSEIRYMPIKADCLLFVRTSLPYTYKCQFHTTYNFLRIAIQLYDKVSNKYIDAGFETYSGTDFNVTQNTDLLFLPQMPSIGKIEVREIYDETEMSVIAHKVSIMLLTQELRYKKDYYNEQYADGNGHWFFSALSVRKMSCTSPEETTGPVTETQISIEKRADIKNGGYFAYPTNNDMEHTSGKLYSVIQSNFAAGYCFAEQPNGYSPNHCKRLIWPKEFGSEDLENGEIFDSDRKLPSQSYIINDAAAFSDRDNVNIIGENCAIICPESNVENLSLVDYLYDGASSTIYRLQGDFKLHNARVLFGENRDAGDDQQMLGEDPVYVKIFANNSTYEIKVTRQDIIGHDVTSLQWQSMAQIELTDLEIMHKTWITPGAQSDKYFDRPIFKMKFTIRGGDGDNFLETNKTVYFYFGTSSFLYPEISNIKETIPARNVAIRDFRGNNNMIDETVVE